MEQKIKLISDEVSQKLGTFVCYTQCQCSKCGHQWGITIFNNEIAPGQLICRNCFANNVIEKLI